MSAATPLPLQASNPPRAESALGGAAVGAASDRDLAFDLLRGIAVLLMVIAHIERQSLLSLVAWERVGMVSSAECFVLLSGVVVGMVSRRRAEQKGAHFADASLFQRAFQLYRVNLALVLLVMALSALPFLDMSVLTTFVDRSSGQVWPTYPQWKDAFFQILGQLALLRAGSHQVQILGLYICLMALAPFCLRLMRDNRTSWLLAASWLCYIYQQASPSMPSGMRFEYAFPLLSWQVLFVHGLAAGYHREKIVTFLEGRSGRFVLGFSALFALACFVFAQGTPSPFVPSWARVSFIPAATFNAIRDAWFSKNALGLGRLANDFTLLLVAWWVLKRSAIAQAPALRWLVTTGQASLYVFVAHLVVVLAAAWILKPGFVEEPSLRLLAGNTVLHLVALGLVVLAVQKRVLFSVIPR